jgi:hypothetical protein
VAAAIVSCSAFASLLYLHALVFHGAIERFLSTFAEATRKQQ